MPERPSIYVHGTSPREQARLKLLNQLLNERSIRLMDPKLGERMLDVGAGLGLFAREVARRTGVPTVGIERSEEQIAEARRLAASEKESEILAMRSGEAETLPLAAEEWGTFDLAHTRFLLEHVTDPLRVVKGMVRAVRLGGRLILEDDDHDVLRLDPEPAGFRQVWQRYIESYEVLGADPRVGRRLPRLLAEAGAKPVRAVCNSLAATQGEPAFGPILENLVKVIDTAREIMVGKLGLDAGLLDRTYDEVCALEQVPGAAFWYAFCWVEGVKE